MASELPLWSARAVLEDPEALAGIHREYAEAGAEAITAATFRTQRRTLARVGLGERTPELVEAAVALARRTGLPVLGSQAPLEDCYRPDLSPREPEVLAAEHGEHAALLARAGVDAILVETQNNAREALAATRAALATGLPVVASLVCGRDARLLSGEPLAEALDALAALAPAALGVNCLPLDAVAACLDALAASGLPFGVQANIYAETCSPETYAAHARAWLERGARFVGGCCGTGPAHIACIAAGRVR